MAPDPASVLPLPPRPHIEQYRKRAKDLVKACKSGERSAVRAWAQEWIATLVELQDPLVTPEDREWIRRQVDQVVEFACSKLSASESGRPPCALSEAQFVIARVHGFESWPKFKLHVAGLGGASDPVSRFEAAADAVVGGDVETLARLLRDDRALVRARSTREHRLTLLHYVGANGFEGYRQKSPANAVAVARILLDAGAEVDALPEGPIGLGTPLGMAATSVHTERAGVQSALIELLLERGASVDGAPGGWNPLLAALHNGRPRAAELLAARGARLDLEGAAGVGRLDAVRSFFDEHGRLRSNATKDQLTSGFMWACEYGRNEVVRFFLENGVDVGLQDGDGQTGLHWAAIGGRLDTLALLLERKASLEVRNAYGSTVLEQALWSAVHGEPEIDQVPVVEALLGAGAEIEDGTLDWLARQPGSPAARARIAEVLRRHGASS